MNLRVLAVMLAVAAAGCETLDETYVAETTTITEESGVRIFEDQMRDAWGGGYFQYRASNNNSYAVCAQTSLGPDAQTAGHSMGGIIRVPAGGTVDTGYVTAPANFDVIGRIWGTQDDGECGYPPSR